MSRIAVILPAYNEEITIGPTITSFNQELPEAEIWVINNRSADKTEEIARNTLNQLGAKGGVINENHPGKGCAVRRAFMDIDADVYVLSDADMTYPAKQVRQLIEPVAKNEADMVVGDRHSHGHYASENRRPLHGFGNRLVRDLVNNLFNSNLADIMSGYRVFNRRFVKTYPILVQGFELETDMTLHALDKRFRIKEIPIAYVDRPEGSFSKLNTVRDGVRVINTISNILRFYRPLVFFGTLALAFIFVGLALGWPVIDEYFTDHFIKRVPLAILATGTIITGLILGAVALILDSITHLEKQSFERELLHLKTRF